jgi:hypothetical protein
MFPNDNLHLIQRSNPVFQVREGIYHQVFQLARIGIFDNLHRFAHVAFINGMQFERNSIVGRGIRGNVHSHLRSGKATTQDSGGDSTKSYTNFIHKLPFNY